MKVGIILASISLFCATGFTAETAERTKVLNEIRETFGMVPTFLREFPQAGLPGAWEDFKSVELSNKTVLDGKTKELIGLAVASTIPCRYCIYFHRKTAALNGAKPEEIKLALGVAASEARWGAYFTGYQIDAAKFKTEVDKMVSFVTKGTSRTTAAQTTDSSDAGTVMMRPMDAKAAYKDMENTFGFVPEFMKAYPEAGIAGVWNEQKDMRMSPTATVLSAKIRNLIALGVASQLPSPHGVYIDTEFATKRDGATPQEISEAVAIASTVRHWSSYINGLRQDEKAFEREVDQIIRNLEKRTVVTPKKVSQKN